MAEITLLVTWPSQSNADGYKVRLLDAQRAQLDLQDVATNSATFGPLTELTTYQLELVAYHSAEESEPQLLTVTTPEGEEGTASLVVAWEDPASGDTARLLDDQGTELQDLGAVASPVSLAGLATGTAYQLELTRAEATVEVIDFTTPIGLPGGIDNLQHTFTTDSLTFTWDAASDAEQYRATLYRDDAQVEEQVVTTLTATFSTLEDGTEYLVAIRAENAQGSGATNYDLATTGYLVPATPTNFHELSTRIIAIEPAWDLAEPTKVLQVRIQVLIGGDMLYDEVLTEVGTTSRLFPVPMAGTDYFVRIQAGNPAGWSGWLEGTASTPVYPLLDTRLAVMAAAYQEDVLHTDTWDGGTDADLEGVGDPQRVDGGVDIQFLDPFMGSFSETLSGPSSISIDTTGISSRALQKYYSFSEHQSDNVAVMVSTSGITSEFYDPYVDYAFSEPIGDTGIAVSVSAAGVASVKKSFSYDFSEPTPGEPSVSVSTTGISSLVP